MSNHHLVSDLTHTVIDSLSAETDPIIRLQSAMLMREKIGTELSKLINESIYLARMKNRPDRVMRATGLSRYTVNMHVRNYLARNPSARKPPPLSVQPITESIPLGKPA